MAEPKVTNRITAFSEGLIFHTHEMLAWLRTSIGAPYEMGEAMLGAWVGVLRYDALIRAEHDQDFFMSFRDGRGHLHLTETLAPEEWKNEELWLQISRETGILYPEVQLLLTQIRERLRALNEAKAFEPIGWFHTTYNGAFNVNCWNDFLQPIMDGPQTLVRGVLSSSS